MQKTKNELRIEGAKKYKEIIARGLKDGYTNADILFLREVNK